MNAFLDINNINAILIKIIHSDTCKLTVISHNLIVSKTKATESFRESNSNISNSHTIDVSLKLGLQ